MTLEKIGSLIKFAKYVDDRGRIFWFFEKGTGDNTILGLEGANVEQVLINGISAWYLYDDTDLQRISVIWSTDDKWFEIDSFMLPKEEILRIAANIRRIIR